MEASERVGSKVFDDVICRHISERWDDRGRLGVSRRQIWSSGGIYLNLICRVFRKGMPKLQDPRYEWGVLRLRLVVCYMVANRIL